LVRASIQAPASSVIADTVVAVIGDIAHIHVTDVVIDPRNRAVVIERAMVPVAALVAVSEIAVAIIDTAIEPDIRAPIAAMPAIAASAIAPVSRRPQRTDVGG
jgi:hypothetical protein